MSKSKRKKKPKQLRAQKLCRCWLCDPDDRNQKHKDLKERPDPELRKDMVA